MKTIGERIKSKRKELGMTQAELAQKLNVTDRAVSKWEVDEGNPDLGIIPNLCKVLGITTDYLLLGKEEKESISMDDMDDNKRFELIFKNDDIENFNKYKYFDKKVFQHHIGSSKYEYGVTCPNEKIVERMLDENKKHLLKAFFNQLVSKYKVLYNDNVYVNTFFCKTLDKLVKSAIDIDYADVLKTLGIKFLELAKDGKDIRNLAPGTCLVNNGDPKHSALIQPTTIEYIFKNAKAASKCFNYIVDLPLESENGKCFYFKYPIENLIIELCLKYEKYGAISRLCDLYDAPIQRLNKKKVEEMQFSNSFLTKRYYKVPEARLVAFDEKTIHHLLINDQEKLALKLIEHNKKIYDLFPPIRKPKIYIMNDNDVKQYVHLNSDKYSEQERYEYSCVKNRIIVKEALLKAKDIKFVKKILKDNYLNYYEFAYYALLNNKKDELYKEFVDIESSNAREVLRATNDENKKQLLKYLWGYEIERNKHAANPTGFEGIETNNERNNDPYTLINNHHLPDDVRDFFRANKKAISKMIVMLKDNPIIEYFDKVVKQKICDEVQKCIQENEAIENEKLEREKIVKELTKDYFIKLLANDGEELFFIKLCSLFDAYLKFDYKIEGEDFSERMNTYFKDRISELDGEYDEEKISHLEHLRDIFNRLRMLRNNIAHAENNKVEPLSDKELRECLDYTFSIAKGGK